MPMIKLLITESEEEEKKNWKKILTADVWLRREGKIWKLAKCKDPVLMGSLLSKEVIQDLTPIEVYSS